MSAPTTCDLLMLRIKRFKPLLELSGLITAVVALIIAMKSDAAFHRATEILEIAEGKSENELAHHARDDFNLALDDASKYCPNCTHCAPAYAIQVPLNKAVTREPEAAAILSAGEYNRLAMLGSSVWDFKKAEYYVKKAMDKSSEPFDKFFSNLLLGHLNYSYAESDPTDASIQVGNVSFTTAVACMEPQQSKPAVQSLIGQAYGLWALHELLRKDTAESDKHAGLAKAHWKNLPDEASLNHELNERLAAATNGIRPEIACLFRSGGSSECADCAPTLRETYPVRSPTRAYAPGPAAPPSSDSEPNPTPDRAIAEFNEAIKLDPKNAVAYYDRGVAYGHMGEYDKEITDCTEAIRLDPKLAVAYCSRGAAYHAETRYDSALADYNEAIKLNPKLALAYFNRGMVYRKNGERAKAEKDFDEAKKLGFPQSPTFEPSRQVILEWQPPGDRQGPISAPALAAPQLTELEPGSISEVVIAKCSEDIKLSPKNADAYFNRGNAYRYNGEHDKAIADYTQVIRLNPKSVDAYRCRGYVYEMTGKFDEAIADYTKVIQLNPNEAGIYCNRGCAYRKNGNPDKAIADFTKAILLHPNPELAGGVYYNRGQAYDEKGEKAKAKKDFDEANRIWLPPQ